MNDDELTHTTPFPTYHRPATRYSLWEVIDHVTSAAGARIVIGAQRSLLASQEALVHQATSLLLTQHNGRRLVEAAIEQADEQQAKTALARTIRSLPPESARRLLAEEAELARRLAILDGYDTLRHNHGGLSLLAQTSTEPKPTPQVDVDLSDEQIQAEALRAVAQLGSRSGDELRDEYRAWKEGLESKFPEYVCFEIIERADKMLQLLGTK